VHSYPSLVSFHALRRACEARTEADIVLALAGSVMPPFLAHVFCNIMGVPQLAWALKVWPERKLCTSRPLTLVPSSSWPLSLRASSFRRARSSDSR